MCATVSHHAVSYRHKGTFRLCCLVVYTTLHYQSKVQTSWDVVIRDPYPSLVIYNQSVYTVVKMPDGHHHQTSKVNSLLQFHLHRYCCKEYKSLLESHQSPIIARLNCCQQIQSPAVQVSLLLDDRQQRIERKERERARRNES